MKANKILTGVAGEYLVAGELSRRGYVATLTLRNTRGIDILVSNADATKIVGIQVKANSGSKPHWLLSDKIEHDVAENLFYVFVNLNGIDAPDYYIVPRSVVSKTVSENHGIFLKTKRKDGKDHNPTTMRSFQFAGDVRKPYSYPDSALYKNDEGWKLLGLELGVNS